MNIEKIKSMTTQQINYDFTKNVKNVSENEIKQVKKRVDNKDKVICILNDDLKYYFIDVLNNDKINQISIIVDIINSFNKDVLVFKSKYIKIISSKKLFGNTKQSLEKYKFIVNHVIEFYINFKVKYF